MKRRGFQREAGERVAALEWEGVEVASGAGEVTKATPYCL